jgi:hypothetical protein
MEEQEYRQAYHTLNPTPCVFEKAILSGRCACCRCQRLNIAEREAAACSATETYPLCVVLLQHLRQNAQFALKLAYHSDHLPHAKEMSVQCGGLLGLQILLFPEEIQTTRQVKNIDALIKQAVLHFGQLDQLPYQKIVKFISHYQVRPRHTSHQD